MAQNSDSQECFAEGLSQARSPAAGNVLVSRLSSQSIGHSGPAKTDVHAAQDPLAVLPISVSGRAPRETRFEGHARYPTVNHQLLCRDVDVRDKQPGRLPRHLEELVWAGSLMYGVGSWSGRVRSIVRTSSPCTSSHHVSSSISLCSPSYRSQSLLLRAHSSQDTWWLVRGRPPSPAPQVLAAPLAPTPSPVTLQIRHNNPGVLPQPSTTALMNGEAPHVVTPNPWLQPPTEHHRAPE